MKFKHVALVASAFVFAACGGSGDSAPASGAPADAAAAAPAGPAVMAPATGATHEIKMVMENNTYAFVPANVTVKAGDAVKFTFVSGGPHNVVFEGTTLAAAVKAQLDANFAAAGKMAGVELTSNMFMAPGEGITISFAKVPAGAYAFNCTPHLAMGMKGVITVQ